MTSVLTVEQASQFLQVSPEELMQEINSGQIPAMRIGSKVRISQAVLEGLLGQAASSVAAAPLAAPDIQNNVVIREQTTVASVVPDGTTGTRPTTPVKKFQGIVIRYSTSRREGEIRWDKSIVLFSPNNLVNPKIIPCEKDKVEFELQQVGANYWARQIVIIDNGALNEQEEPYTNDSTSIIKSRGYHAIGKTPTDALPKAPYVPAHPAVSTSKLTVIPSVSANTTPRAKEIFHKATSAQAQGNTHEAKQLYRQAITAGAGAEVYISFYKMLSERGDKSDQTEARQVIQEAIQKMPYNTNLYDLYGQMERKLKNLSQAKEIFELGIRQCGELAILLAGLAKTLVQINSRESLGKAGVLYKKLETDGKLNRSDGTYIQYITLSENLNANQAYNFFKDIEGIKVYIAGKSETPPSARDLVVEINNPNLKELFGLSGAFLVRCFQRLMRQSDLMTLKDYIASAPQVGTTQGKIAVNSQIAFVFAPNTQEIINQTLEFLTQHAGSVLITLQFSENRDNDYQLLAEALGQYFGKRDLYDSASAVAGRRFFGREQLLSQLADMVVRGEFIGIYGLRKMGKTSLIHQFRDVNLKNQMVAYVDLQASGLNSLRTCDALYWEIESDLYNRLHKTESDLVACLRLGQYKNFSELPDLQKKQAGLVFLEDMRKVLRMLKLSSPSEIKRLVIILDELEYILPIGNKPAVDGYIEFFAALRGLAQEFKGYLVSMVAASNASISERSYWDGRENPVYGLYKAIYLPPMPYDECKKMIEELGRGMTIYWDEPALQAVFDATAGHPFITRRLCSHLAKCYPERPLRITTASQITGALDGFLLKEGDKLEQITEMLESHFPAERQLFDNIVLGKQLEQVSPVAMRHLLHYYLLREENGRYVPTLKLLESWVKQLHGF